MDAFSFSRPSPALFSLFFFFFFLLLLPDLHHCDDRFAGWTSYKRSLLVAARRSSAGNQISSCKDQPGPSQCNRKPNCRWCRSDAVDDTCFHKSEAWRLPYEVFTCDQSVPSSRSMS